MNDLVKPVGQWIADNIPLSIGIGLFLFCLFFEISKIKVYPLKWLWKCISFPFRKIDEQRTQSFKNIVLEMKSEIDNKLTDMTASFDNKLNEMATSQNLNCAAVKAGFVDLEKRFDSLDEKQRKQMKDLTSLQQPE